MEVCVARECFNLLTWDGKIGVAAIDVNAGNTSSGAVSTRRNASIALQVEYK
jgi:hypothetical protein